MTVSLIEALVLTVPPSTQTFVMPTSRIVATAIGRKLGKKQYKLTFKVKGDIIPLQMQERSLTGMEGFAVGACVVSTLGAIVGLSYIMRPTFDHLM
jgi:hypothetical protein